MSKPSSNLRNRKPSLLAEKNSRHIGLESNKVSRENRRRKSRRSQRSGLMALTNFILTVVGVSAAVLLLRSDVKQSAAVFRRNVKHIRNWLEEESSAATKAAEKAKPKELDGKSHPKEKD